MIRLKTRIDSDDEEAELASSTDREFIFLSDNVRHWLVRMSEIVTLEASGNYTHVTLKDGTKVLVRRPLIHCARKLDSASFFRTWRNCIVNLGAVQEVRSFDSKRFLFLLVDGSEIVLSKKQTILLRRQKAL